MSKKRPTHNPECDTFDWFAVLEWQVAHNDSTAGERRLLSRAAGDWPTCACGQLCQSLKRKRSLDGETWFPEDHDLFDLGIQFNDNIRDDLWDCALEVMHRIESRTKELLEMEGNNERTK